MLMYQPYGNHLKVEDINRSHPNTNFTKRKQLFSTIVLKRTAMSGIVRVLFGMDWRSNRKKNKTSENNSYVLYIHICSNGYR